MLLARERIIFLGTPEFAAASLRALLMAQANVVGVVTQPDRPKGRGQAKAEPAVKQLARAHALPVWQPERIRTPEFERLVRDLMPSFIVVVAFGRILPANILAIPPQGCINVHASLLPRWRGAAPIQWAIAAGDRETGVTTMLMDEGLDTGPILLQRATPIGFEETAVELHDRLAQMGAELLVETLTGILANTVHPRPQPETGATYARPLKKEDGAIDWSLPASVIHNRVRGFTPWPGAYTHFRGQYLKVLRTLPEGGQAEQGSIEIEGATALIGTGEGRLRLLQVQPAGRAVMTAGDFFRGTRLQPQERLVTEWPVDDGQKNA